MAGQVSSLSSALSIAISGLNTSVGLINVASNNIANAQTPGYSEETANVVALDYGSTFGGSTITSYSRATNTALTNNYNLSTTQASYYSTQNNYMGEVQAILDSTDSDPTLTTDIANFASAWTQYNSQPSSSLQQQAVVTAGQKLAEDVNSVSNQLGQLQSQVVSDTTTAVTSFNSTLQKIATLNSEIQQATNAGQSTGTLEDQRDTAVNTLSGYTSISIQSRPDGQIAVYTPSGQPLVDGVYANQYSTNGYTITDSSGNDVSSTLTGGSLQAQLDFVSTSAASASSTTPGVGVISKLNSQLTELVDAFTNGTGTTTSPFASAYSAAYTASTATGATQNGDDVASSFYTTTAGTADPSSFQVNPALLDGSASLPQTGTQAISDSFTQTANYTASGLNASGVTYAQLGSAILANFQQIANSISSNSTTATSQQTYYKTALTSAVGVNMDDELARLTTLQNSYAASANIITTINTLLTNLMSDVSAS